MDRVWADVIMVGQWMLCLGGRYHGRRMDILRERMGLSGRCHGMPMDTERIMVGLTYYEAAAAVCPVKRSTAGSCLSASYRSVGKLILKPLTA